MTSNDNNIDWYEGNEPEVNFNELNLLNSIQRYGNNTINTNIDMTEIKPAVAYKNLKPDYDHNYDYPDSVNETKGNSSATMISDHPIHKFNKIKSEIDLIEKDIQFYEKNPDLFKSKHSLPSALLELKNIKDVVQFIGNSNNYKILNEIKNAKVEKEFSYMLNKELYSKLNQHLFNKLEIINKIKSNKIENFKDLQFELYLTPDTIKVKQFTKLTEMKKTLTNIENKLGMWDIKAKKASISEVVSNMKKHLRLFDKDYQKEIRTKMDALSTKLKEINEGKEEFYMSLNKPRIDELSRLLGSSKIVEDIIFKTISKMELLKNNHEESAYIFVKLKEMLEQQERISSGIAENEELLLTLKENIKTNVEVIRKNLQVYRNKL